MRKILKIGTGFALVLVGIILSLPGVPGPGIAVIIVGLVLLSEHFHWARKTLDWMKQKAERIRDRVSSHHEPADGSNKKGS